MREFSNSFYLVNHFIWWMICSYLAIDSLTGFVQLEMGITLKLSLIFKTPLIALMLTVLMLLNKQAFLLILSILICFLVGPLLQLLILQNLDYFFLDFSFALKLTMPIIVFMYIKELFKNSGTIYQHYCKKALIFAGCIVIANLILGIAGKGYSTYGQNDTGVGITGYFYAGNELGGLLIITFCYFLHSIWNNFRKFYFIAASSFLVLSILVATKSAVLGALLSGLLIPFVNERQYIFRFTKLKLFVISFAFIAGFLFILLFLDVFVESSFFGRLEWAYKKFGLLGLIFSGRQEFIVNSFELYSNTSSIMEILFGKGVTGIISVNSKYSAEVDPIDTLVWFGITGLFVMLVFAFYFIVFSFKKLSKSVYAPGALLANCLLLFLAFFSGHIWTSGMLGISWAVFNGLLLTKTTAQREL